MNESTPIKFLEAVDNFYKEVGISIPVGTWIKSVILLGVVLLLSFLFVKITQFIVLAIAKRVSSKTKTNLDDLMLQKKVFHRLSYIPYIFILHSISGSLLLAHPVWLSLTQKTIKLSIILIVLLVSNSIAKAIIESVSIEKPQKTFAVTQYINLGKIILWAFGVVFIISTLLDTNPIAFIGGLTAFMAVLVLVFKDPLLGLTASIQIVSKDLLRIGDWITINKSDVDGVVTEINLVTVKIENWDKTISSVPTYSFISDSFQNWRGMQESGVRRIKRSIFINVNSVRYCDDEMLERYKKIELIKGYVERKQKEFQAYNETIGVTHETLQLRINGKNQTNLGIFRKYLVQFLHNNTHIAQDKTLIVRQLQPTEKGLPVEIYVFSKIQEWEKYEEVQSDIFDHVLAAVPMFDLQVFQNPSGADFRKLSS